MRCSGVEIQSIRPVTVWGASGPLLWVANLERSAVRWLNVHQDLRQHAMSDAVHVVRISVKLRAVDARSGCADDVRCNSVDSPYPAVCRRSSSTAEDRY